MKKENFMTNRFIYATQDIWKEFSVYQQIIKLTGQNKPTIEKTLFLKSI